MKTEPKSDKYVHVSHGFPPFKDENSLILILGSFPSVKSREHSFFYMHPQNRFYKVLSSLSGEDFYNASTEEKKRLLKKHHIALYDVIEECDIIGSDDSSIKNVIPADLKSIMENTKIKRIFINGNKAYENFVKYDGDLLNMAYKLPSTSSANARMKLEDLVKEWAVIR